MEIKFRMESFLLSFNTIVSAEHCYPWHEIKILSIKWVTKIGDLWSASYPTHSINVCAVVQWIKRTWRRRPEVDTVAGYGW